MTRGIDRDRICLGNTGAIFAVYDQAAALRRMNHDAEPSNREERKNLAALAALIGMNLVVSWRDLKGETLYAIAPELIGGFTRRAQRKTEDNE